MKRIALYILEHPNEKFDVTPFVDSRCKTPIFEIQAAVDGAISNEQAIKLRQCLDHIDEIERIVEPFSDSLALLRTVPDLNKNPMTAIAILSEFGERYRARRGHKKTLSICKILTASQALHLLKLCGYIIKEDST